MKFQNPFLLVILFPTLTYSSRREVRGLKCPGKCIDDDPAACGLLGGKIIGYCTNELACCDCWFNTQINGGSCDTITNNANKVSYFRSPNYPKETRGDLICEFHLNLNSNTLGVKLDFVSLQMDNLPMDLSTFAASQTSVCGSDMMFIKGFSGWSPDIRCGNLTGYSMLVETEIDQKRLSLVFVMASSGYKWNIRLTQIAENEVNSLHALLYNNMTHLGKSKRDEESMKLATMKPNKSYLSGHQRPSNYFKYFNYPYSHMPISIPPPLHPFPYLPVMQQGFLERDQKMSRIAGGQNVEKYAIPWQVSIQSVSQFESSLCGLPPKNMSIHLCGGSILDDKTIITSAHCFYSPARYPHPTVSVDELKVVVGKLDLCKNISEDEMMNDEQDKELFAKEYSISQVILHFNYFSKEILNDLAILRLKEPIKFNQGVRPIMLADEDFNIFNKPTLLSGWGSYTLDNDNMSYPSILQQTSDLTLIPENECISRTTAYLNYNLNSTDLPNKYVGIFDRGICAKGGGNEGVEAGYGDSGGPLAIIIDDKNSASSSSTPVLVGVVSHMRAEIDSTTNETFHLDYFVKLSSYKNWILMAMI